MFYSYSYTYNVCHCISWLKYHVLLNLSLNVAVNGEWKVRIPPPPQCSTIVDIDGSLNTR